MPGSERDDPAVGDLTVQILRAIRAEIQKTNLGLAELRAETHEGFAELRAEMRRGFGAVNRRVDNLLVGAHRRSHQALDERVARLEAHVGLGGGHGP